MGVGASTGLPIYQNLENQPEPACRTRLYGINNGGTEGLSDLPKVTQLLVAGQQLGAQTVEGSRGRARREPGAF